MRKRNAAEEGKKKTSNDDQKEKESLGKEEQRLEKEEALGAHSPASAWWRKIRVSPKPGLGGIYRPAPGKPSNDGFGALLGKQPRSGGSRPRPEPAERRSAWGLDALADKGLGFISSRILG